VEERNIGKTKLTFTKGYKEPKALRLLLRAKIKNINYELVHKIINEFSVFKNTVEKL